MQFILENEICSELKIKVEWSTVFQVMISEGALF
jgi:hypothetical protein